MTALTGVLRRGGSPIERPELQRMLDALAHRQMAGIGRWNDHRTALGALNDGFAPSWRTGRHPFVGAGPLVVLLDGRLDNRAQLSRRLGLERQARPSDPELLLRAYERWGLACAGELVGDFAFAIWDRRAARLFCARDRAAVRPLYYAVLPNRFLFATELGAILRHPKMPKEPNEAMMGEHLLYRFESCSETLYQGIERLPAGHCISIANAGIRVWRYWDPSAIRPIRYRSHAEYAEHFRELLLDAVAARLPEVAPPAVSLSGGIDSSAVAGAAQERLAAGSGGPLDAYSLIFPGLPCDESAYIDQVVKRWGLRSTRIRYRFGGTPDWWTQTQRSGEPPEHPVFAMGEALLCAAAAGGSRVLLTGEGGDEWLSGSPYPFSELLRSLALTALWGRLRGQCQQIGLPTTLKRLMLDLLWSASPAALRPWPFRARSRPGDTRIVNPSFLARHRLADRLRPGFAPGDPTAIAPWHRLRFAAGAGRAHFAESMDRADALRGVERRHPLHDQRLADFALAVTDDVHADGNLNKLLLRRASPPLLPPAVAARRDRAFFDPPWQDAISAPLVRSILSDRRTQGRPWAPAVALAPRCATLAARSIQTAGLPGPHLGNCWMAFAVELWFRANFEAERLQ